MSTHKAAYDAVYAYITQLGDQLPPDEVHRNAMIWRAVEAALKAEFTANERTAWQQGYEFALTHLADPPVQADRARYLAGETDTAPTIPTEHPGPTYMTLDHGPWVPSGLECGDIHPTHDDCEQPVMQRTVTAVYPSRRVDLGVELEGHERHTEGGEGELAERLEDAIDAHLEEDAHTTASTKAADAVMAQIRPLLEARDARIAELEVENQRTRKAIEGGVFARVTSWRREAELVDRLRRRDTRVRELKEENQRMRGLVDDLADPEPCRYDHHGYCQEHGWFETEPKCAHARARETDAT